MRLFGLIGYPLTHSFSKKYFSEKFEKEKITDARYEVFEIDHISKLQQVLEKNPELQGLSVTIPYKESVIPFLHSMDDSAKKIGAVNVIRVVENKKLKGYNSDYYGFRKSLLNFIPALNDIKALVLGTGGAAKAVIAVLNDLGIPNQSVSREKKETCIIYKELPAYIPSYHLIINTTPAGMYPNIESCPDIPYELLGPNHFLFDLVYNPRKTAFLKKGEGQGAKIMDGLEMLHQQAEKAWEIWNEK